jgi:hypothetical protein
MPINFSHKFFHQNFFNMSQLLINKLRGLAGAVALLVVFLVVGTVDASAQGQRTATVENPYLLLAQKLGVTACQQGTASNVQGGVAALDAWMESKKSSMATATLLEQIQYEYYSKVVAEVRDYYVAPEIALLAELSRAGKRLNDGSITTAQFASLYNTAKVPFGMCN